MPIYRLMKRKLVAEIDVGSDLLARQYAQADPGVVEVQTENGRVVYRKVPEGIGKWADPKKPLPDVDLSSFNKGEDDI